MARPVYKALSHALDALQRCRRDPEHFAPAIRIHEARVAEIMAAAPSGSGIDSGTTLDEGRSSGERLVFYAGFHHMDDSGYYDGWTEHIITVTPSLVFDFTLRISGRDRNRIKDYMHDVYHEWLSSEAPEWSPKEWRPETGNDDPEDGDTDRRA